MKIYSMIDDCVMISKTEEITVIAPNYMHMHGHHQWKFKMDLIIYLNFFWKKSCPFPDNDNLDNKNVILCREWVHCICGSCKSQQTGTTVFDNHGKYNGLSDIGFYTLLLNAGAWNVFFFQNSKPFKKPFLGFFQLHRSCRLIALLNLIATRMSHYY